jgi:hypothetical protein
MGRKFGDIVKILIVWKKYNYDFVNYPLFKTSYISNLKIVVTEANSIPLTQMYMTAHLPGWIQALHN